MNQAVDDNGKVIERCFRPLTTEVVDGTSSSAQSSVITTRVVRIACSVAVNILVGDNPTATADTVLLPAGTVEYIKLDTSDKIAVLGGKLYITKVE